MARINYYAIELELQKILKNALGDVNVTIEVDQPMDTRPWVAIYLEDRTTPDDQPIAAGMQTRMQVKFSIWCWHWSLETQEVASKLRDQLLGDTEIALMKNRKLNDKVLTSWLAGGEFLNTSVNKNTGRIHASGGEIVLMTEVKAVI